MRRCCRRSTRWCAPSRPPRFITLCSRAAASSAKAATDAEVHAAIVEFNQGAHYTIPVLSAAQRKRQRGLGTLACLESWGFERVRQAYQMFLENKYSVADPDDEN